MSLLRWMKSVPLPASSPSLSLRPLTAAQPTDIARIHGDNERISLPALEDVLNFYRHVIENAQEGGKEALSRHRRMEEL
jgi:hypothetical protein